MLINKYDHKLTIGENKNIFAKKNANNGLSYLTSDIKGYLDNEKAKKPCKSIKKDCENELFIDNLIKIKNKSFLRLNGNEILEPFINRVLFCGNIKDAPCADVLYHGTLEDGLWASKTEILNYLLNCDYKTTTISFSHLTYQPWNRILDCSPEKEYKRHIMQIKWGGMANDLIKITNNRRANERNS